MENSLQAKRVAGFERLIMLATIAVYLLIFVGGLVRVSGAGLGCPDWPQCFGRWLPPLSVSQIPPDIDATLFNLTLAWIEYFNRLIGVLIGFLIAAAAIVALIRLRKYPRLLYPTIASALLVAFQGWQGSVVVSSELTPLVVTVHMLLALLIASLLTYVSQEVYYLNRSLPGEKSVYPIRARRWVGMLWLGGIAQVIIGTQVRAAGEQVTDSMPLLAASEVLRVVGDVHQVHMVAGVVLALFTGYVAIMLLRLSQAPSNLVRQSVYALAVVALGQIAIGLFMAGRGLGPLSQLFHLWGAAIYIGLVLVLYSAMRRRQEHLRETSRSFRRVVVMTSVIVVGMAIAGVGVVRQAEASRADIPVLYEIPEFEFAESRGESFGRDDFLGKLTVVDFVFTSCRGICPPMMATMSVLYRKYEHSDKLRFVSFTVDPETDTPERLMAFASSYGVTDRRWSFVRGDIEKTRWLASQGFKVSDDLPVNHSSRFILVDEKGFIRGYYRSADAASISLLEQHIRTLSNSVP